MINSKYRNLELLPFVEILDREYYFPIEKQCSAAKKQANRLSELEVAHATSQYVSLCSKLIGEVETYIAYRKDELIPYLVKLSEKGASGHDCSSCTGSCKLQHDVRLMELKGSHLLIKETVARLQMAVLPLYSDTMYPDTYRVLRNNMALLENNLTELLFYEEAYLVPKVAEAQNSINAGNH